MGCRAKTKHRETPILDCSKRFAKEAVARGEIYEMHRFQLCEFSGKGWHCLFSALCRLQPSSRKAEGPRIDRDPLNGERLKFGLPLGSHFRIGHWRR